MLDIQRLSKQQIGLQDTESVLNQLRPFLEYRRIAYEKKESIPSSWSDYQGAYNDLINHVDCEIKRILGLFEESVKPNNK